MIIANPFPMAGPANMGAMTDRPPVLRWVILAGLLYAGYRRGQKIEKKPGEAPLIWPFLGWSLLGPVGPGYMIGRLTS